MKPRTTLPQIEEIAKPFLEVAAAQRAEHIAEQRARLEELERMSTIDYFRSEALNFDPGHPGFEQAVRVARAILQPTEGQEITHVCFNPTSDQHLAWKVYASLGRGGPYCGTEKRVFGEELARVWVASA